MSTQTFSPEVKLPVLPTKSDQPNPSPTKRPTLRILQPEAVSDLALRQPHPVTKGQHLSLPGRQRRQRDQDPARLVVVDGGFLGRPGRDRQQPRGEPPHHAEVSESAAGHLPST